MTILNICDIRNFLQIFRVMKIWFLEVENSFGAKCARRRVGPMNIPVRCIELISDIFVNSWRPLVFGRNTADIRVGDTQQLSDGTTFWETKCIFGLTIRLTSVQTQIIFSDTKNETNLTQISFVLIFLYSFQCFNLSIQWTPVNTNPDNVYVML